jgi:hypothetical protein
MNRQFSPDDPKLTAYALGELDAAEIPAVEARLQADPAARRIVAEIRVTAGQLEAVLSAELGDPAATELEPMRAKPEPRVIELPYARRPRGWAQVLRFPQSYFLISGAAAAIFVGMVLVGTPRIEQGDRTARQLAAEQRARAISEARYEALRDQLRREQRATTEAVAATKGKVTQVPREPVATPGIQFAVPVVSLLIPRPDPIADIRHLSTNLAPSNARDPYAAAADLSVDSGNEEGGDDLVRMDPLLVEDDPVRDLARSGLLYPFTIASVLDWARSSITADDPGGFRREYINGRRSDGG